MQALQPPRGAHLCRSCPDAQLPAERQSLEPRQTGSLLQVLPKLPGATAGGSPAVDALYAAVASQPSKLPLKTLVSRRNYLPRCVEQSGGRLASVGRGTLACCPRHQRSLSLWPRRRRPPFSRPSSCSTHSLLTSCRRGAARIACCCTQVHAAAGLSPRPCRACLGSAAATRPLLPRHCPCIQAQALLEAASQRLHENSGPELQSLLHGLVLLGYTADQGVLRCQRPGPGGLVGLQPTFQP